MKLVLYLIENIVRNIRRMDDAIMNNVTNSYPYNKEDDPTNPYAKSLRIRDDKIKEGYEDVSIMVVPDGDPDDYLLKLYKDNKFSNDNNEIDSERLKRAGMIRAQHSIGRYSSAGKARGDWLKVLDLDDSKYNKETIPNEVECESAYGADKWNNIKNMIIKRDEEILDKHHWVDIENGFRNLSEECKHNLKYHMAYCMTIIAEHTAMKNNGKAIDDKYVKAVSYWWSKFISTDLHIRAVSEIASSYVKAADGDKATDLYEELLKHDKLTGKDVDEINDRIQHIGRGNNLVLLMERKYETGDYDAARKFVKEFDKAASGRMLVFNKSRVENIKTLLDCRVAKKDKDIDRLNELKKKFYKKYPGVSSLKKDK